VHCLSIIFAVERQSPPQEGHTPPHEIVPVGTEVPKDAAAEGEVAERGVVALEDAEPAHRLEGEDDPGARGLVGEAAEALRGPGELVGRRRSTVPGWP